MFIPKFLLLANLFNAQNSSNSITTDLVVYQPFDVVGFLTQINEGSRLINDLCEDIDEKIGIMGGSTKPECIVNMSYINNEDIVVYKVDNSIRKFLVEQKKTFCSGEKIECGELTILIKILDLINNAVKLSVVSVNFNELNTNLKIIDFNDQFITYKHSLSNIELLTNITLSKQKINVILERERTRLKHEMNKASYHYFAEFAHSYVGEPIKKVLTYTGSMIGETLGETIDNIIPSLSIEGKVIIFLGIIYLIKRC